MFLTYTYVQNVSISCILLQAHDHHPSPTPLLALVELLGVPFLSSIFYEHLYTSEKSDLSSVKADFYYIMGYTSNVNEKSDLLSVKADFYYIMRYTCNVSKKSDLLSVKADFYFIMGVYL